MTTLRTAAAMKKPVGEGRPIGHRGRLIETSAGGMQVQGHRTAVVDTTEVEEHLGVRGATTEI